MKHSLRFLILELTLLFGSPAMLVLFFDLGASNDLFVDLVLWTAAFLACRGLIGVMWDIRSVIAHAFRDPVK